MQCSWMAPFKWHVLGHERAEDSIAFEMSIVLYVAAAALSQVAVHSVGVQDYDFRHSDQLKRAAWKWQVCLL